jgi:hypothetical protein
MQRASRSKLKAAIAAQTNKEYRLRVALRSRQQDARKRISPTARVNGPRTRLPANSRPVPAAFRVRLRSRRTLRDRSALILLPLALESRICAVRDQGSVLAISVRHSGNHRPSRELARAAAGQRARRSGYAPPCRDQEAGGRRNSNSENKSLP